MTDEKIYGRYTDPKFCTRHKELEPLSEFGTFRRDGKLYYRPYCKAADRESSAAHMRAKRAALTDTERVEANARQREWYNNRPDVVAARIEREQRPSEIERLCEKCGDVKPIDQFAPQRRVCKDCKAEDDRKWRVNNAEHMAEWHREYNQQPERKAKQAESSTRSYHNNREARLTNRRDYVAENPDKVKAANQISEQRRRARLNSLPPESIESIDRVKVFERDNWRCQLPKCSASSRKIDKRLKNPHPLSASLDHIIPVKFGGAETYANVQAAHLRCNHEKGYTGAGDQLRLI